MERARSRARPQGATQQAPRGSQPAEQQPSAAACRRATGPRPHLADAAPAERKHDGHTVDVGVAQDALRRRSGGGSGRDASVCWARQPASYSPKPPQPAASQQEAGSPAPGAGPCAQRGWMHTCSAFTGLMAAVLEGCTSGATMRQLAWLTTLLTCTGAAGEGQEEGLGSHVEAACVCCGTQHQAARTGRTAQRVARTPPARTSLSEQKRRLPYSMEVAGASAHCGGEQGSSASRAQSARAAKHGTLRVAHAKWSGERQRLPGMAAVHPGPLPCSTRCALQAQPHLEQLRSGQHTGGRIVQLWSDDLQGGVRGHTRWRGRGADCCGWRKPGRTRHAPVVGLWC